MTDLTKTLLAVVVAGVLVGAAALTRPTPVTDARFSDQGEMFFPALTDPLEAASLDILSFDATDASLQPFRVELRDGKWIIPSHHNYPADAQANMAKAASAFIGLKKELVVSDRAADHGALGVLGPDDPAAPLAGRGTRVTLRNAAGAELASLIIGGSAPDPAGAGGSAEQSKRRYVRVPDKARVYAVSFPMTFSTRFAEWVETDLLKLEGKRVDRLLVDRYEVDERSAEKREVERLVLSRIVPAPVGTDATRWTMESRPLGGLKAGESLDEARIDETIRAVTDMKIIGVRAKPPALAAALAGTGSSIGQSDFLDLQARGFFVTRDGRFVANDGELTITAEDGVVYNIAFGEILFGRGEELSAGVQRSDEDEIQDATGGTGTESRYVMVRVSFDPTVFPEPSPPSGSDSAATPQEGDTVDASENVNSAPESVADEAARQEYERLRAERDTRISEGRVRAEALTKRFADWYYVIDAASYGTLRPTRERVVVSAEDESEVANPPALPDAAGDMGPHPFQP